MRHSDLDKKRLEPCMAEVYNKATSMEKRVWPQSYDTWSKHGIWGYQSKSKFDNNKPVTIVPMECYHLSQEDFKEIVGKWCKGLRGWWYYIPKLNYGEPDYNEHVKELEDFRKFEAEVSKDKSLTYAQRAAKIKKEALAHNFMWRSSDKEYINYNIYLGPSPSASKEAFDINSLIYEAICELASTGFESHYIDYTKLDKFQYKDPKTGNVLTAKIENTTYWYEDGKLRSRKLHNCSICNLYNDKWEYVDNLWNYMNILRTWTANLFEDDIDRSAPLVTEIFKRNHPDVYDKLNENNRIDRYIGDSWNYRQCWALYLMHISYIKSIS